MDMNVFSVCVWHFQNDVQTLQQEKHTLERKCAYYEVYSQTAGEASGGDGADSSNQSEEPSPRTQKLGLHLRGDTAKVMCVHFLCAVPGVQTVQVTRWSPRPGQRNLVHTSQGIL